MLRQRCILLFLFGTVYFGCSIGKSENWENEALRILNDPANSNFLNSLEDLKADFQKYDFDVDRAIPWKELNAAMEALDILRQNYNGNSTADLIDVQETKALLMDDYRKTTNDMFRWAVSGKERLRFLVKNQAKLKDMSRIKRFTENILGTGSTTIDQTVRKLNAISASLIDLEYSLKRIKKNIMAELDQLNREFEEYEKMREEFNNNLAADKARVEKELGECHKRKQMVDEAIKKSQKMSWIIRAISGLVSTIAGFMGGPIGAALGMTVSKIGGSGGDPGAPVSCAGVEAQFEKIKLTKPLPSKEEEKRTLNMFYDQMGVALENAIRNVSATKKALDEDINYIEGMSGKLLQLKELNSELSVEDNLYELVFEELDVFAKTLDDYIQRHSSGTLPDFKTNEVSRHRRRRHYHGLSPMAELEMEFDELTQRIEDHLNRTDAERNARFWILDYDGYDEGKAAALFEVQQFMKY